MKKKTLVVLIVMLVAMLLLLSGLSRCTFLRQASRVSRNLSLEADSFNVARKLTVINQRTDTLLFQVTGNFSIANEGHNELAIIGENDNGTYYKHFIYLSDEVVYIVEDLGKTSTSRYRYQINLNPSMLVPFEVTTID